MSILQWHDFLKILSVYIGTWMSYRQALSNANPEYNPS